MELQILSLYGKIRKYSLPTMPLDWIGLDWNALFRIEKIVEKKSYAKIHKTSSI